ncbi:hypothetical protein SGLAM104S_05761 [Streptomyces glaucescens]
MTSAGSNGPCWCSGIDAGHGAAAGLITVLYWASPNADVKGFRWITPGSFLALVLWVIKTGAAWTNPDRTTGGCCPASRPSTAMSRVR